MLHTRTIRKIIFGQNPLNEGLVFVVNQSVKHDGKMYTVIGIEEDGQYFREYGDIRYNVYIKRHGKGYEEAVWKSAVGVPVVLEFELPGDEPDKVTVS